MGLDSIIVLVLVLGAVGVLVGVSIYSRRKEKQGKSDAGSGQPTP